MKTNNARKQYGEIILILIGIVFLLDQFSILSATWLFDNFWALFLAYIGVMIIIRNPKNSFIGIIALGAGIISLLNSFNIISVDLWSLWPIILIIIGINLFFRENHKMGLSQQSNILKENEINDSVIFCGIEKKVVSNQFQGSSISVLFGGAK